MLQMIIVVLIGIAVVKFFQRFGGDNSGEPWDHDALRDHWKE